MKDKQNENHQPGNKEEVSKTQAEAQRQAQARQTDDAHKLYESGVVSSQAFSWKRLMAKKWVFPAVYLAAAAIILSIMWAINSDKEGQLLVDETPDQVSDHPDGELNDAFPVAGTPETWQNPVPNETEVEVIRPFYEAHGTNEAKQAATIHYGNTLRPSMGVTLALPDGEAFPVVAALSGTVTRSDELPVVGHVVEVTHEDGLKTVYSSLANVIVAEGDELMQGEQLAEAGRSEMGKEISGSLLHFEVMEDGEYVNPTQFLPELELE